MEEENKLRRSNRLMEKAARGGLLPWELVKKTLEQCEGNIAYAADVLGVARGTIYHHAAVHGFMPDNVPQRRRKKKSA